MVTSPRLTPHHANRCGTGHLESGDAIHDIIRFITAPVHIIGTGWVGSAAVHLYLAVPRERRYCLPNTRFLIHQPKGGSGGQASDIAIHAQEITKARERDRLLSAPEAVDYGLVGRIIEHKSQLQRR